MSETSTERYERLAEAFYKATHKVAPGKDVPVEMGGDDLDERVALWRVFIAGVNLSEPVRATPPAAETGEPVACLAISRNDGLLADGFQYHPEQGTVAEVECMRHDFQSPAYAPHRVIPLYSAPAPREVSEAMVAAIRLMREYIRSTEYFPNVTRKEAMERCLAALSAETGTR